MKTKYLLLGIVALLIAGGVLAGRVVWRSRRQLITLNVRNMPLADVLRKLERQTGKKLRAEQDVEARITLHLSEKPLNYVLDCLAEQARARWSTLYAVYGSKRSLDALDSALRHDGRIEPAGWTKIAPHPADADEPGAEEGGAVFRPNTNPDADAPMPGPTGPMLFRRTPDGSTLIQGPNGQVETWSPEQLVMDSALKSMPGNRIDETGTANLLLKLVTNGVVVQSTNMVLRFPPETTPLLLDYEEFHARPPKSGKNVVFMDGHVAPLEGLIN